MNSEPRAPRMVVTLALESAVSVELLDVEAKAVATRLGAWLGSDSRRRDFLMLALELARPRPGDLEAGDEVLAALAAALAPAPDPYAARVPWGTYQSLSLQRVLATGEAGRTWVRDAARRDWPLDASFAAAVRAVAAREGLVDEDGPR